jgi:hypothetical protein
LANRSQNPSSPKELVGLLTGWNKRQKLFFKKPEKLNQIHFGIRRSGGDGKELKRSAGRRYGHFWGVPASLNILPGTTW